MGGEGGLDATREEGAEEEGDEGEGKDAAVPRPSAAAFCFSLSFILLLSFFPFKKPFFKPSPAGTPSMLPAFLCLPAPSATSLTLAAEGN